MTAVWPVQKASSGRGVVHDGCLDWLPRVACREQRHGLAVAPWPARQCVDLMHLEEAILGLRRGTAVKYGAWLGLGGGGRLFEGRTFDQDNDQKLLSLQWNGFFPGCANQIGEVSGSIHGDPGADVHTGSWIMGSFQYVLTENYIYRAPAKDANVGQ